MSIITIVWLVVCSAIMVFSAFGIIKNIKDIRKFRRLGKELDALKDDATLTIEQKLEKLKDIEAQF